MFNKILMAMLCFMIAGCASSWKQTNHESLDEEMLKQALNECDFEKQRKLTHLYHAGSHGDDDATNERMRKEGDKIYQNALLCMKKKGFTK